MATGGQSSSGDDRRQTLTCSICIDIFRNPRLLPCGHSFCCHCLEDLAAHGTSPTLRCPYCRAEHALPEGGVSNFARNIYVRLEDLHLAREGIKCLAHPKEDMDLYCKDCDVVACQKCLLTRHQGHVIQDLSEAATQSMVELMQEEDRVKDAVSRASQAHEEQQRELQALQDKKAAVTAVIQRKYRTAVMLAEKCRDDQLARVDAEVGAMQEKVCTAITASADDLHDLQQWQQRLQQVKSSDTPVSVVTLATQLSQARPLNCPPSAGPSSVSRPVLNSGHTLDMLTHSMQAFFGTVYSLSMQPCPTEVEVQHKFTCGDQPDTEIFSLCPMGDGKVWVSYVTCGLVSDMPFQQFEESGLHLESCDRGKYSLKSRSDDSAICHNQSDTEFSTYSKNKANYDHHIKLTNRLQGKAGIYKETVTSEDPFKVETVLQYSIQVGLQRAMDCDSREKHVVVVEEAASEGGQRQVKLYGAGRKQALDTYTSPTSPFQPADVCFVTLAGREVLVIADEAGDSVHVVQVKGKGGGGGFRFLRHLAAGHPLLVQPTTLNTDPSGRLWVACRGGAVLTFTPV